MTRLVGEIHTTRADRARTIQEMKQAVAGMQAGFHSAHAEMARNQRRMLHGFVSGLRGTVAGLRKEFADDIAGAHGAWGGAATAVMPGRSRRGGKWFGGESA
jgi:hypothetical protein